MARTRVRITPLLALSFSAVLLLTATGCGGESDTSSSSSDADAAGKGTGPVVVATTSWEGAFAKAAGAEDVTVIVPESVQHAPDYDPKPSDLAAVADADFVLYAPFEPYAEKFKEAAGGDAELVEVNLDNDADKAKAEVTRLGKMFGTEDTAAGWITSFDTEYGKLQKDLKSAWPDGKAPTVVAQVFSAWSAKLAGAEVVGMYGPEAVTAKQLSDLSKKKPQLVLDNVHMTAGTVLPDSGARQVGIVNYPDKDLDLLTVYKNAATTLEKAMNAS
ncbi:MULTISPECIES: metal ABC transporter solute-binding protein, Zn/Mn family [Streptomyces]|uniref:Zinc ABC transporter solute-binding protein n=2 Tax=Streptomyces TaxID=1883 RepID=A0ABU3J8G4_9ACTN|nr:MULTISPECIES: zinc ABC transporter substrate-binding protein [Actinomycetes]MBM7092030.1 zinc ABC transporter solute-binding protein [Streptomyces sp. S12]MBT2872344.1 zinc ABC transporter solute-binding protein [Streptomyces sp. McG7]MDT6970852.1 zinc ABC transporter solute-binding protein [Streptomyces thermocarboxydus]MXQ61595.1 ABC transporter substrate-binding protein [Streptomyces sp. XHT-2]MYQ36266.1 ABC transporter substrate-binding protein [Streptomyces sp. SID4956]MYW54652.1 ABC 